MDEADEPNMERLAKSVSLTVFARLSIVGFSIFGPLVGGYLFSQMASTQRENSKAIAELSRAVALVSQRLDTNVVQKLGEIDVRLADHETRMRLLERNVRAN